MSQSLPHVRNIYSTDSRRVVGLFPQLLGVGGVQEAGRLTAAALDEIAQRRKWDLKLLSLNDEPGTHAVRVSDRAIPLIGFGHSKQGFVWSALGLARGHTSIVLAAHPHLALPAELMKIRDPSLKTIVMSHGIEVWKPLPTLRRLALQRANWVLAPSGDTARKVSEVQLVAKEKVLRLPWPVNQEMLEENGVTVWLDCPFEVVRERVDEVSDRPLARDPGKFRELFESRRSAYAKADYRVEITSDDPAATVASILKLPIF